MLALNIALVSTAEQEAGGVRQSPCSLCLRGVGKLCHARRVSVFFSSLSPSRSYLALLILFDEAGSGRALDPARSEPVEGVSQHEYQCLHSLHSFS